jgi:hypothetical protein
LWDVATGRLERAFPRRPSDGDSHDMACVGAELSRDGRLLAASSRRYTHFKLLRDTLYSDPALRIWERLSGQEVLSVDSYSDALAFSFDGKLLAANEKGGDPKGWDMIFLPTMGSVHLWDTLTGKCRRTFGHHTAEVRCVAFAPDGKTLASGSADHTVLVWDCSGALAAVKPLAEPSAKQLSAWWESLADSQALVARQALAELVRRPAAATRLLGDRLKPATAPDPGRVAALVRDLSDPRIATRERATEALAQLGELAAPALSKATPARPRPETRRRLRQALDRAAHLGYRKLRAVAVLEEIGDDNAVRVLRALAKGLPESTQTVEAQVALRRLRR